MKSNPSLSQVISNSKNAEQGKLLLVKKDTAKTTIAYNDAKKCKKKKKKG